MVAHNCNDSALVELNHYYCTTFILDFLTQSNFFIMLIRCLICLMFSFTSILCYSQESNLGNWLLVFGNKQFNEKVNWHHEIQHRNYNAIGDLEQLLIRTGIGVNVSDNANLLQGYGFIRSENYINDTDKAIINEHRLYQQLITKQSVAKLRMQHRYRFE